MSVVDFAALPPEVNSARMYAGAGSGPLLAAAAAWDKLAAELSSAAGSYRAVVSELTDDAWLGPASASMTAAVAPYVEWMDTTSAQAEQTANQARAAAAAYEAAFAAVVPPAVIAANRASLASLVATNIVGQNTHAIAANQAQYAQMWTQDATAMHSYTANSAAATTVTPFTPAPQDTKAAAPATQGIIDKLNQLLTQLGNFLQNLGTSGPSAKLLDLLTSNPVKFLEDISLFTTGPNAGQGGAGFTVAGVTILTAVPENAALAFTFWWAASQGGVWGMGGLTGSGSALAGSGPATLVGSESALGASGLAGSTGRGVAGTSAGLGRAASVGGLSVPQSWGTAPEVRLAAKALPAAGSAALPQAGMAAPGMAGLGGMPMLGSVVNAPRNGDSRSRQGSEAKESARIPGEAGGRGGALNRWVQTDVTSVLSERDELNKLRKAAAELAKKRDALTISAAKLIRQAME